MRHKLYVLAGLLVSLMLVAGGCGDSDEPARHHHGLNDLVREVNSRSQKLVQATAAYGEALNAFNELDPLTAGANLRPALQGMVAAGHQFLEQLDAYGELMEDYQRRKASTPFAAKSSHEVLTLALGPDLVYTIGKLLEDGLTDVEIIMALLDAPEHEIDWDEADRLIKEYKQKHTANAVHAGSAGLAGTFGGIIIGGAAAAALLPATVVVGAGIGGGIVVGAIWSWCTRSRRKTGADEDYEVCMFSAVEGEVTELPNGEMGVAFTLPEGGPGTMCLHAPGMEPICLDDLELDEDGIELAPDFSPPPEDPVPAPAPPGGQEFNLTRFDLEGEPRLYANFVMVTPDMDDLMSILISSAGDMMGAWTAQNMQVQFNTSLITGPGTYPVGSEVTQDHVAVLYSPGTDRLGEGGRPFLSTSGQLTLTRFDDRIVGSITANMETPYSDSEPPGTGVMEATFNVAGMRLPGGF